MTDETFEELLAAYLEHSLAEGQLALLRAELKASSGRLSEYLDLEEVHAMLKCRAGFSCLAARPLPRRRNFWRIFPLAAAAIALLAGGAAVALLRGKPSPRPAAIAQSASPLINKEYAQRRSAPQSTVRETHPTPAPVRQPEPKKPLALARRNDGPAAVAVAAISSKPAPGKGKAKTGEKTMKQVKLAAVAAAVVCAAPSAVKAQSAATTLVDGKAPATFIDTRVFADSSAAKRFLDARAFVDSASEGRATRKIDTAKPLGTVIMLI